MASVFVSGGYAFTVIIGSSERAISSPNSCNVTVVRCQNVCDSVYKVGFQASGFYANMSSRTGRITYIVPINAVIGNDVPSNNSGEVFL